MPTPNISTTRIVVAVRGDRRPGLRVAGRRTPVARVGEEDDDQRRQRDQHRAVDRAEQDQHQQHRRQEQLGVEVAEDLLGVGREAEVAGDEDPHARRRRSPVMSRIACPSRPPSRSRWAWCRPRWRRRRSRRRGWPATPGGERDLRGLDEAILLFPAPGSAWRRRDLLPGRPRSARPPAGRRPSPESVSPCGKSSSRSRTTSVDSALAGRKDSVSSSSRRESFDAERNSAKSRRSSNRKHHPLAASTGDHRCEPSQRTSMSDACFRAPRPPPRTLARHTIDWPGKGWCCDDWTRLRPCIEGNHG